ncbi:MAG: hypothetical protein V1678_05150, partial [Candidatus Aenigmatarchaeota archaeon]
RKIMGVNFRPSVSMDRRMNCYCLYFPPIFAKHYVKLGISEKAKRELTSGVPDYISNNEDFQRIWLQGTLSEDGSLYPFVQNTGGRLFISPVIQWNRNNKVDVNIKNHTKSDFYQKDIKLDVVRKLKSNINPLIRDEARFLRNFNIEINPMFSRLHVSNKGTITAVYSVHIRGFRSCENWLSNISFELKRHKKQLNLLLGNHGSVSKSEVQEILIKFYSLIPRYLRDKRKILSNKWLEDEQKIYLMGDSDGNTTADNSSCRAQ